jgi:[protein-PII] uridylyltransferase
LKDPAIFSSLTESRFLCGNVELYSNYLNRLQRLAQRRSSNLIKGIVAAREKERLQFGETVNLLRPNVKKSRGGLRDLHLIRWLGFVRFGESDVDQLCRRRAILDNDATLLHASGEFLLTIRNELHFHAGRANDQFDRNEQVRVAEKFGYRGDDAVLPVERLMQSYFRYTSQVRFICDQFVANSLARRTFASSVLAPLVTRQIGDDFYMGPAYIGVVESSLPVMAGDLSEVLRLMQLAGVHDKKVDYHTWESIRDAMSKKTDIEITRQIAEQFMALLSNARRLADSLQVLHEMFVLEKIIPEFSHARNLLQFNEYHKYTVDEHSLQAVRVATSLADESTAVGRVYRQLKEKNILHLALLLHDLGKGFPEDHCEVGRRIAEAAGKRLFLTVDQTEDIKFLVHNHLVMTHLAFHRDINDEDMVAEFASNIGSVRLLSMLYVLTCADVQAVGPGVLTAWKYNLLTNLYQHAKEILTGHHTGPGNGDQFRQIYEEIGTHADSPEMKIWLQAAAANLPKNYCEQHEPQEIAKQLLRIRGTQPGQVQCWVKRCVGSDLFEMCIAKREQRRSGLFYKTLGLLASQGLAVRSADIKSLGGAIVLYWFKFEDREFENPPQSRADDLRQRAVDLALGVNQMPPTFPTRWGKENTSIAQQLSRPRIEVKIDNQTVDSATIIDVFAYTKRGLLYKVSKQIHELGLDVKYARISTYARQLIAVFYVTDEQGNKVRNRNQLQVIKQEIYRTTKNYLEPQTLEKSSGNESA